MESIFFISSFSFLIGFLISYFIFHKKSPSREEMIKEKAKIELERERKVKIDEEREALLKEEKELNKGFINK